MDEDGNEVAYNVEGEIWIRGPQLSKGYFNLPDENINLFTEDGWARTGEFKFYKLLFGMYTMTNHRH